MSARPLGGRSRSARFIQAAAFFCALGWSVWRPSAACAAPDPNDDAPQLGRRIGKPVIKLDRLTLPENTPDAAALTKYLRRSLAREARKLDWGAGQGSRVSYRFAVTSLSVVERPNVVTVSCTARGYLPNGQHARSRLSFGGDPKSRANLLRRVLDIVARGVLTRLAELERTRRGIAPLE